MSQEEDTAAFLAHYGVKGMQWGVRKNNYDGASASTNREAKKDANEFARAKLFYGEGAGNRRKLIKATVEAKSKRDETYKKAFDHHLERQDLAKHAGKARSERKRKDTTESVTKTSKGVYRQLTGGFGNVSMASAVIAGGYVAARNAGYDKVIADAARTSYRNAMNNTRNMREARSFLKDMGL